MHDTIFEMDSPPVSLPNNFLVLANNDVVWKNNSRFIRISIESTSFKGLVSISFSDIITVVKWWFVDSIWILVLGLVAFWVGRWQIVWRYIYRSIVLRNIWTWRLWRNKYLISIQWSSMLIVLYILTHILCRYSSNNHMLKSVVKVSYSSSYFTCCCWRCCGRTTTRWTPCWGMTCRTWPPCCIRCPPWIITRCGWPGCAGRYCTYCRFTWACRWGTDTFSSFLPWWAWLERLPAVQGPAALELFDPSVSERPASAADSHHGRPGAVRLSIRCLISSQHY